MIKEFLFAQVKKPNNCSAEERNQQGAQCLSVLPEVNANSNQLQNGLSIFFGIVAAVAILVIVIAAINMATSEGNPENISKAKKSIIYALIGLLIALAAQFIVLTFLGRL